MKAYMRKLIALRLMGLLLLLDILELVLEKTAALHGQASGWDFYLNLLHQPWMWFALALGPIQLWIWTKILARTDLSFAYPISSLSYALTMYAAQLIFHEHLSLQAWVGALLTTVGVAIVSSGDHKTVLETESPAETLAANMTDG